MRLTSVLIGLCVVACSVPEDAPEELGEPTLYLFANFDGTDEELVSGTELLEEFLLTLDLDGDINDRAFTPDILTGDDLGGIPVPSGTDTADQVPVAVAGRSVHSVAAHQELVAEPNHVCIESNTTVYYDREFLTDVDCFVADTCLRADTDNVVRKESLIANIWYDQFKDYRRITLSDGRAAMLARSWSEDQYFGDSGANSFDQSYLIDAWIEDADSSGSTLRYTSMWSAVTVGLLDDAAWATLVKGGLDEALTNADNFIDDVMCSNDRDKPASDFPDRP